MSDFDQQVNELLTRAMQQPGVVEIVQLYEKQRAAVHALEIAQHAVAPRWVVSASSSSSAK